MSGPVCFFSKSKDAEVRVFSNFAPCRLKRDLTWTATTVEHEYQALKFELAFRDTAYADYIRHLPSPVDAKKAGSMGAWIAYQKERFPSRTKKSLKEEFQATIQQAWIPLSTATMLSLLRQKFSEEGNPVLHARVEATGTRPLHEVGRPNYWTRAGQDMLGRLLMVVRAEFRE
jgi:predicted NAD-dependent protein-ADP-ribosyltransferase YbiA (DUF1768 family)